MKPSKRRIWIGTALGVPVGIGISFVYDNLFGTQVAPSAPVIIVGVMLILHYFSCLKFNIGVFGKKPLGSISFTKRLSGLMFVTGVACACAGVISSFFFASTELGQGAVVGGLTGASTSGSICAGWELLNRIFPKQASIFLNGMFPKKRAKLPDRSG